MVMDLRAINLYVSPSFSKLPSVSGSLAECELKIPAMCRCKKNCCTIQHNCYVLLLI